MKGNYHPRRCDGTFIKDSVAPKAYYEDMSDFQALERALGRLHTEKGNTVRYHLVQPLLGWASHGKNGAKVKFHDISKKGVLDPLTLYIHTQYWRPCNRMEMLLSFFDCVDQNRPSDGRRLRIVCDEMDVEDAFVVGPKN